MNLYGEGESTYGSPIILVDFRVPSAQAFKLSTLIGWGDTPAEFSLFINEYKVAGCRNSPEHRTSQVWWENQIVANDGDEVMVTATHNSQGLRSLCCNLILIRL